MRLKKIKDLLKQKSYFKIFLMTFIFYLILSGYLIYYFFNGFYLFFNYSIKYYPWLNILFTLILALLFGIKEVRKYNNESGTGIFTSVLSLFSAGCPVCSFTILSFLIPGISVTFSLAILPFKGLEIQLLGILLLIISIFILTKENVCKII